MSSAEVKRASGIDAIVQALLDGYCAILTENESEALLASAAQTEGRSITEPKDEQTIVGPHEGFVENLNTNLYLVRKRLRHPRLKVRQFTVGKLTNTKAAMLYVEGLVDPGIVAECARRISTITMDQVFSVGNIADWIDEHPLSPLPMMLRTERPDRVVAYLTEGKIAILVDGSTNVLIVPISFFAFYQSPDDYSNRWIIGTNFRLVRFISFHLAIILPAVYIAIVSFHAEILPIGIFYSIQSSLAYVPFPPLLEALVMQIVLEILKEAAIRLPSPIAQTIGIVGGLVIGTAVVEAHLVSNMMIVVIGLTAIASFASPLSDFGTALRILGFPTMMAAALFGFFGIMIMLMFIVMHLCKLETFGVPYLSPLTHYRSQALQDTLIRAPSWKRDGKSSQGGGLLSLYKRWKSN